MPGTLWKYIFMIAKPPKFGDEAHDCHKMPELPLEYDNFTQKWHIDMKKTLFLRDVAEISAGYPFRVGLSDDPGGKIRVVQMRDVSPAMGVNWASTVRVQHEANMESYFLRHDDILFVMRGGNYYGTLLANPPDLSLAALHFFRVHRTATAGRCPLTRPTAGWVEHNRRGTFFSK